MVNHLLERATDRPSGEGIYRSITDPCLVLRFRTRSLIHVGFPPCHPVECNNHTFSLSYDLESTVPVVMVSVCIRIKVLIMKFYDSVLTVLYTVLLSYSWVV